MSTPSSQSDAKFAEQLKSFAPHKLDDHYMDQLVSCTQGSDLDLSPSHVEQANTLKSAEPAALPSQLNSALLAAISDTPFHEDEKVVLFNQPNKTSRNRNPLRSNLATAAAVALMGCLTALFLTQDHKGIAQNKAVPASASSQAVQPLQNSNFVPASFSRNLSGAHDEGVIWKNQRQPHRLLRLTYTDEVQLRDESGEIIQVSRPKHEYVILPEKID